MAAPSAGTWTPRAPGIFGASRKPGSGNARSGDYAVKARAFMRAEGVACYKIMTPGSLRVDDVVDTMFKDNKDMLSDDPKVVRLIESWTQRIPGVGESSAKKVLVKQTD